MQGVLKPIISKKSLLSFHCITIYKENQTKSDPTVSEPCFSVFQNAQVQIRDVLFCLEGGDAGGIVANYLRKKPFCAFDYIIIDKFARHKSHLFSAKDVLVHE